MTISALNRWRLLYLGEAGAYVVARQVANGKRGPKKNSCLSPLASCLRATLWLGAILWLMHDLAHGRWRAAIGDLIALAGCAAMRHPAGALAIAAGVAFAAAKPEAEPSPFVWS